MVIVNEAYKQLFPPDGSKGPVSVPRAAIQIDLLVLMCRPGWAIIHDDTAARGRQEMQPVCRQQYRLDEWGRERQCPN